MAVRLTGREDEVAKLIAEGADISTIEQELHMARRTVKAHLHHLYLKYGITSGCKRVKLAVKLFREQQSNRTKERTP